MIGQCWMWQWQVQVPSSKAITLSQLAWSAINRMKWRASSRQWRQRPSSPPRSKIRTSHLVSVRDIFSPFPIRKIWSLLVHMHNRWFLNSSRQKQSVKQENYQEPAINSLSQDEPLVANERAVTELDGNAYKQRPWQRHPISHDRDRQCASAASILNDSHRCDIPCKCSKQPLATLQNW